MATFFSPADQGFQPKRKFRFLVNFSNLGADSIYMVTKAAKPSFELSNSTEHRILNHTFKYPGIVKWTDIDITLLDAFEPNIGSKFYNVLEWTLKNAFLKRVKFGDLAYDDEGLVTIDIGISYDFATYTEFPQGITV